MDRELWRRIKALHFSASKLSGEERERYLAENCATAEERDEVDKLLQAEAPTEFMSSPGLGEQRARIDLEPGHKLGRYEIQELLGSGGGGKVYRAYDPTLRRQVALKILSLRAGAEEADRRRFLREAESVSALSHPNIITVYEVAAERGIDYIAMEFIDGKTLRDSIPKHGLNLGQFFPWAVQIAEALAAAHDAGVVHRDMKPGNVMITSRGVAKVLDFGLAKVAHTIEGDPTLTQVGTVMGTVAYMAPEQAEGKPVDGRSDIFSLGCMLYEMLTGRLAFHGDTAVSVIGKVLHKEPEPLATVAPHAPPGLDLVIGRCIAKDPAARWRSAADVRILLERIYQEWQANRAVAREAARASRWKLSLAAAAGAVLALSAAFWYVSRAGRAEPAYRTVALTTDAGLSTTPSISRDGRLLAYASDRSGEGNVDIWIQQIGGQEPIRLTQDEVDETDPDLSPDGTRVAFRSEKEGGGIYVVPALGGQAVLLAQGGRNPKFSPDGKWIAYWSGRDGGTLLAGSARAYVIPARGGEPKPAGSDLAANSYPIWSPAGDSLLVVGRKNPDFAAERQPQWWVAPLDGSASRPLGSLELFARGSPLVVPYSQYWFRPLVWTFDGGGRVIFEARTGDSANLWAISVDARGKKKPGVPFRITGGSGMDTSAAVSHAGAIAYATTTLRVDLWSVNLNVEKSPLQRITEDLSWEFYPSLSWDGTKATYAARRGGGTYALCLRDLLTGRESTLFDSADRILSPRLSGDGNWVVLSDSEGSVSRIATRGGATTRLCEKCGTSVDVSANGDSIMIEPMDRDELRALDASTGSVTTVLPERERLYSGRLSHDRKWVVFNAVNKGSSNSQIFVSRLVDGHGEPPEQWIPITSRDAMNQGPEWSPDGNALYFRSERDGFRCVWRRRLNPLTKVPLGPEEGVLHFHHARQSLQHIKGFDDRTRIALGGNRLVLAVGELTGNIWMREPQVK